MPRPRLIAGALLAASLLLLPGCAKRSCGETDADLEPLEEVIRDRLRASVGKLYYGASEYWRRVVRVDGFAFATAGARSYEDEHWKGSAPSLLIRATSEESGAVLSCLAPGWERDDLEDVVGKQVALTIYVPAQALPPAVGHPAEVGRILYLCE